MCQIFANALANIRKHLHKAPNSSDRLQKQHREKNSGSSRQIKKRIYHLRGQHRRDIFVTHTKIGGKIPLHGKRKTKQNHFIY
jgi:hypothetical protein